MKSNIIFGGKLILGTLLSIFIILLILDMVGFSVNKHYFTYDREQCIQQKYNTGTSNDIESCVYWMRANNIEREQEWRGLFEKELLLSGKKEYCENPERWNFPDNRFSFAEPEECRYQSFAHEKREENLPFLISNKRDDFFEFCAAERCPKQTLFK